MHMVRHSRLCGRAIVAYLQSKGFPEVALHFVREPRTRFRLALACGNIEAAMESAFSIEQQAQAEGKESGRDVWGELGSEALRQGNHQVSEWLCFGPKVTLSAPFLRPSVFTVGCGNELPTDKGL